MPLPSEVRRAAFLAKFDLSKRDGLEIGPFDSPVFDRGQFENILYADVKDTAELRRMADNSAKRDANKVVPVDFVLLDKRLDQVVPKKSLDFVFCAHVLEHVPDMIGMLNSVEAILRPGGLFLVVYPDRRYTYDIDRPPTTLAQLRDRHARRITKPDPETVLEHFLHHRKVRVGRIWNNLPDAKGPLEFTPERAQDRARAAQTEYIDVHCNLMTAQEFGPMIDALNKAGETRLKPHLVDPTRAPLNEFYVALQKPMNPLTRLTRRLRRRLYDTDLCINPLIR